MQPLGILQDSDAEQDTTTALPKMASREPGSSMILGVKDALKDLPAPVALHSVTRGNDAPQPEHDSDVDSRDESSTAGPLHASVDAGGIFRRKNIKSRLTLSAYRRPECTIRLTGSDSTHKLETTYNLHAPGCGVLGHGAFSTVRKAVRRKDGTSVAVKSIAKHEALRAQRLRLGGHSYLEEWEILRKFHNHPHIITLLDIFETDEEIQLVLEYCRGGELFDAIQKKRNKENSMRRGQYTEAEAAKIVKQILNALVDLHSQGIVHRDVKPENILLAETDESDLRVKLCDFGMARPLHGNEEEGSCGEMSPMAPGRSRSFSALGFDYYVAPEVVYGDKYGTAVDVYSLGVTLYILLCGFPPVFTGDEMNQVVFPTAYWKDISEDAKSLVRKMLVSDPCARISALQARMDRWFKEKVNSTPDLVQAGGKESVPDSLKRVRSCLFKCLTDAGDALSSRSKHAEVKATAVDLPRKKRARVQQRRSTALMALADFYREVQTEASVDSIAVSIPIQKEIERSFSESPVKALSV